MYCPRVDRISQHALCWGGVCSWGLLRGEVSAPRGCLLLGVSAPRGVVSQHVLRQTPPCEQNHTHLWKHNLALTSLRAVKIPNLPQMLPRCLTSSHPQPRIEPSRRLQILKSHPLTPQELDLLMKNFNIVVLSDFERLPSHCRSTIHSLEPDTTACNLCGGSNCLSAGYWTWIPTTICRTNPLILFTWQTGSRSPYLNSLRSSLSLEIKYLFPYLVLCVFRISTVSETRQINPETRNLYRCLWLPYFSWTNFCIISPRVHICMTFSRSVCKCNPLILSFL